MLGGVKGRVLIGRGGRRAEDEEPEMRKEEVRRIIERFKKGKASEKDGVPNEVWKYGGERVVDWCGDFIVGFGKKRGGRKDGRKE